MKVEVKRAAETAADTLAVAVTEDGRLSRAAEELDRRLNGRLARLVEAGEVRGDPGRTLVLHVDGTEGVRRVAAAGVGAAARVDPDALRTAAAAVVRGARDVGGSVGWLLDEALPVPLPEQARALVDGTLLGSYDPGRWKTGADRRRPIDRLVLGVDGGDVADAA